jgi:molybdopterin/thiamine biosynthesis adenylyltransferase
MRQRAEALSRTLLLSRYLLGCGDSTDADVDEALASTTVAIVADGESAASGAGQGAITTLAGLVLGMGCNIRPIFPDAAIFGLQPPLTGQSLVRGLMELARQSVPGTRCFQSTEPADGDLVFVIGNVSILPGPLVWLLHAEEWSGGTSDASEPDQAWTSDFCIGCGVAAAVAAPEVFKYALRQVVKRRRLSIAVPELIQPVPAVTVRLAEGVQRLAGANVGHVDFVSGGAITNSALHVLFRIPNIQMVGRIFEPETLELSNLNRYLLCTARGIGVSKAELLARLAPDGVDLQPHQVRLDEESLPRCKPLALTVVVGTDNLAARWLVQAQWPAVTIVGATADFTTITSSHRRPGPCAGCLHPVDDDVNALIPTVSFVSYWAGLMVASRLLIANLAPDGRHDRDVLELWPLRLDLVASQWWHPVQPDARCPVKCAASRGKLHS